MNHADRVHEAARQQNRAVQAVVEEACEKALQGGEHGVLVRTEHGVPYEAGPHLSVPYGEIHYREGGRS